MMKSSANLTKLTLACWPVGTRRRVGLQDLFQSVKRQIGDHRGADTPLWHPRFRGVENMLLNESCLQPFV